MTAKEALVAEATNSDVTFEYDGVTYTVARDSVDDVDVIEAYEDRNIVTAARTILGPVQWATFKSKKRKSADLGDLTTALFGALGTSTGESSD